ncbi:MAG TPA: carbamoyltransferase HypF, partial [Bryobacteraceae bacterium]|nr:carbamoyltransferase HypF [Bryobacteraceae bacterium]
ETGLPQKIGVQHHHAHITSCMAENGLSGEVIGVALDGTGYGTDGRIWGGEFLAAGYARFARRAHFRYVPLAGGDAAVREPWRAAMAYLTDTFGASGSDLLPAIPASQARVLRRMMETGTNTVETSSCGRLFDAVASILGLRQHVTFEGQAAIELETIAEDSESGRYDFHLEAGEEWTVDFRPTIEAIVQVARAGRAAATVAAKFHHTLAEAIVETCRRIRGGTGLKRICLSGGTFQNWRLLQGTVSGLRAAGFDVYTHARVPPNDGGIALGQAAVAAAILQNGI